MKAKRDGDNYRVTLTPQEAHVLIWGGYTDVVDGIDSMFRTALVDVEDNDFTGEEYRELFGDLDAVYKTLRVVVERYRAELRNAIAMEGWTA